MVRILVSAGYLSCLCTGQYMAKKMVANDWINDEYGSELEEFATEQGMSDAQVKRTFRNHCETFRKQVMDDTSPDAVRRLVYDKLKWHSPDNTGAEETEAE